MVEADSAWMTPWGSEACLVVFDDLVQLGVVLVCSVMCNDTSYESKRMVCVSVCGLSLLKMWRLVAWRNIREIIAKDHYFCASPDCQKKKQDEMHPFLFIHSSN